SRKDGAAEAPRRTRGAAPLGGCARDAPGRADRRRRRRPAERLLGGLGETNLVPPGHAARPDAASSVAPVSVLVRALPASLPGNEQRTPTTKDVPPNPPTPAKRSSRPARCWTPRRRRSRLRAGA